MADGSVVTVASVSEEDVVALASVDSVIDETVVPSDASVAPLSVDSGISVVWSLDPVVVSLLGPDSVVIISETMVNNCEEYLIVLIPCKIRLRS